MDAIFDSVDVKELLPSHDLDDSSLLSAPDLRLIIDRLQVRSLHIKSKIKQCIVSHHQEFSSSSDQCSDAVSRPGTLSDQVSDLVKLISGHSIDAEIRGIVEEIEGKRIEAKEKKELLELVSVILKLVKKLMSAKEDLKAGKLVEAAETLRQLKVALRVRDDSLDNEVGPVVFGLLRKEWTECFDEIQELLLRFVENAVRFDQESNAVHVKYKLTMNENHVVELHTVLKALDEFGILNYGLAKVADLIIKHVISPAVSLFSPSSFIEEIVQNSGNITEAILRIVPSLDPEVRSVDGETMYSEIIRVVNFIYKFICLQNDRWMHSIGQLTWPRMSELIVSNFLSKVIPSDASKLTDFQKVRQCASLFETFLKEAKFISASDDKEERLSNFADNVEVHFAARKKVEILAKARFLLLHSDFSLPQDFTRKDAEMVYQGNTENSRDRVVNLLFSSEKCVISEEASKLLELVHETLKEMCLSSTRVALELYHAARDAPLLYEAVTPVQLERQLNGINQVAVLINNDCLFLSEEILGLAFQYRSDFPSSIKDAVFIDLATRFQLMAEEILRRQIQLVTHNLLEAVDGADGFQNTHQIKQYDSAKFSIDQVVFIVEKVRLIWEPLLLPLTYKRSMCLVLESVLSRMTSDLLLLDDIAAEETLQLQRLIHLMLDNLSSLLESLMAIKHSQNLQERVPSSMSDLIPSLRKIRRLADLLDMPLKSITMAWETGDLVSCGYTSSEVKDFIRAIFTDSPLRKECLWKIDNTDF